MLRLRPLRLLPLRLQPLAWSGGSSGVRDATNDARCGAQRATNGVRSGAQVQIQLPAQLQPPAQLSNSTGSAKSLCWWRIDWGVDALQSGNATERINPFARERFALDEVRD